MDRSKLSHSDSEIAGTRDTLAPSRDIKALIAIMAALRDKDEGCPWDIKQSFETIAPYTIEEAYEVADAIARADMANLVDELGDLLLQVVFHAQMGNEAGLFDFGDVVQAVTTKLLRRHPHVFGDALGRSLDEVNANWEHSKREERASKGNQAGAPSRSSVLDGVALSLPALSRAVKLQARAAEVGFDWRTPGPILNKLTEEIAELSEAMTSKDERAMKDEIGDLIFTVANLARRLDLDPETAGRAANAKFERRFRAMEDSAARSGRDMKTMSLEELEALWVEAKRRNT
jgi:nucleoside triphosphate diphosphatase